MKKAIMLTIALFIIVSAAATVICEKPAVLASSSEECVLINLREPTKQRLHRKMRERVASGWEVIGNPVIETNTKRGEIIKEWVVWMQYCEEVSCVE